MSKSPNSVSGDARCRQCRRAGEKLYLKGTRCYTKKCGIERRNYAPGQHGNTGRPAKITDYGLQLREKQKMRQMYRVLEGPFRTYVDEATRRRGVTGENLLQLLELRLDNVVYRLGFASSRAQARQLVNHGHFQVNGRAVDIPSYQTRPGDTVRVAEGSRKVDPIQNALASVGNRIPGWLSLNANAFEGKVIVAPRRDEIDSDVQEQIIIEFYSR
uniref:Small ribosomal subunit protein uS4 n=1 Tax=uncultured Armatimonadetes bacterium TaxID=157466 RepID=A0A6J4JP45_9BACT|nr:SSU ribosomal protein S4p (S9e) @ SSU ribosomal protein S4p (S9e), zinc-dependent [uncultured Armatimonadetes bacterium]